MAFSWTRFLDTLKFFRAPFLSKMEAPLHLCTYSTRRTWYWVGKLVSLWPFTRCKGRIPTINSPYKQVSFLILGTFRYLMIKDACLVQFYSDTRVWAMAGKLGFSFLHYFWLNIQGKFELRNYLVASYYFNIMGTIRRFSEFIWSLWLLFHCGPTSASLPLLSRVPCM